MANTILAFDEDDTSLGFFFKFCKDDLESFFKSITIVPDFIHSKILNEVTVSVYAAKYEKFVFGAYSHGNDNCLLESATTPYISVTRNIANFKDSFFYTFSCYAGKNLGKDLISNECLCFIGYKNEIAIWNSYIKPFVECANFGLIQFFNGIDTFSIFKQMSEKYNEEIDKIYTSDFMIASILRENRDALVLHGNKINIKDL